MHLGYAAGTKGHSGWHLGTLTAAERWAGFEDTTLEPVDMLTTLHTELCPGGRKQMRDDSPRSSGDKPTLLSSPN